MGYKVNRVGTPLFSQSVVPVTRALAPGDIAAWDEACTSSLRRPVIPDLNVYRQFGVVKGALTGSDNLTVGHYLAIGQLVQAPEVANGNAILGEFSWAVQGQFSSRLLISHRVGLVNGALPVAAWDRVQTFAIPAVSDVQEAVPLATPITQNREWAGKTVYMLHSGDDPINAATVVHFLEFADTDPAAGSPSPITSLNFQLAYRGIHTAELIQPFDPTR